jgi:hypothetical protein
MAMIEVKVLVPHSLGGGVDVEAGEIIQTSEEDAERKRIMGFVESYPPGIPIGPGGPDEGAPPRARERRQ